LHARGECSPSLLGFAAAGWPAIFVLVLVAALDETAMCRYLHFAAAPLFHAMRQRSFDFNAPVWRLVVPTIMSVILSLPLFLVALAGGWLASRYGLVIACRPQLDNESVAETPAPEGSGGLPPGAPVDQSRGS
jgi:hypothetical protein